MDGLGLAARPGLGILSYISGRYYSMISVVPMAQNTLAMSANRHYASPFYVPSSTTFDRIGIETTVAAAAGKLLRVGIYANNPADHKPGALLLDSGDIAADAAPGFLEATISVALGVGWYWRSVISDGTPTVRNESTYFAPHGEASGVSTTGAGWFRDVTFGALAASFGAVQATNSSPHIRLRAA